MLRKFLLAFFMLHGVSLAEKPLTETQINNFSEAVEKEIRMVLENREIAVAEEQKRLEAEIDAIDNRPKAIKINQATQSPTRQPGFELSEGKLIYFYLTNSQRLAELSARKIRLAEFGSFAIGGSVVSPELNFASLKVGDVGKIFTDSLSAMQPMQQVEAFSKRKSYIGIPKEMLLIDRLSDPQKIGPASFLGSFGGRHIRLDDVPEQLVKSSTTRSKLNQVITYSIPMSGYFEVTEVTGKAKPKITLRMLSGEESQLLERLAYSIQRGLTEKERIAREFRAIEKPKKD